MTTKAGRNLEASVLTTMSNVICKKADVYRLPWYQNSDVTNRNPRLEMRDINGINAVVRKHSRAWSQGEIILPCNEGCIVPRKGIRSDMRPMVPE
jgi:hypothetical protein